MVGAALNRRRMMALARPAARMQFVLVAIAFGCLAWSFASNDFSVQNVASNSNSELPLHYRIAATWGSHEGSLLLWALMLTGWSCAVSVFSRNLPDALAARVLSVMGLISGLPVVPLLTSNPVRPADPARARGVPDPLLQDPGVFHIRHRCTWVMSCPRSRSRSHWRRRSVGAPYRPGRAGRDHGRRSRGRFLRPASR
jgi:cytochrome c-type biogenesis protein CcmF